MAEIKVEKKNKAPIWPWIVGILVLLGLIWFLVEAFEEEEEIEYEEVEEVEEVGTLMLPETNNELEVLVIPDFYRV